MRPRHVSDTRRSSASQRSAEPRRSSASSSRNNAPPRKTDSPPRTSANAHRRSPQTRVGHVSANGARNAKSASHRPPPKRRRRRFNPVPLLVLLILACIGGWIGRRVYLENHPTYISNVFINGVSLEGHTKEEGQAYGEDLENRWLNEVYTFTYGARSWTFSRSMVNGDIDIENCLEQAWNFGHIGSRSERRRMIRTLEKSPVYLTSAISYDDALLDAFIESIAADIDKAAVDAVVVADMNAPIVTQESETGLSVNREALKSQLVALINTIDTDTSEINTTVPVETLFPEIPSDSLSFQLIADFSTDTSFRGSYSLANVRLSLDFFNGLVVNPGERISFNDVVGPRTTQRGFKEATEYAGDTTTTGVGGGVCQASTTLYNALITAGMTIVDRNQHGMTVTYVDPSCDAAVYYGSKDLVFENNTDSPIYIYTSVTEDYANVKIYGKKPEYYYQLESVMIEENKKSDRKVYIDDTSGKYAYFTTDEVLYKEGKSGCVSEGWIVAYDWETREEVSRTLVDRDYYTPGASVYYRGTHAPVGTITEY